MEKVLDMTGKVAELVEAKDALKELVSEVTEDAADTALVVRELESRLVSKQAAKAAATDVTEAKQLRSELQEVQDELEINVNVMQAKAAKHKAEVTAAVEKLIHLHKGTKFLYSGYLKQAEANVSRNSLAEDVKELNEIESKINNAFSYAVSVLKHFNLSDNSTMYRTTDGAVFHLGQVSAMNHLSSVFK